MEGPTDKNRRTFTVRTGQGSRRLDREEFVRRYRAQFADPAFDEAAAELDRIVEIAWRNYERGDKAPQGRPAGPGFAHPEHEVSLDWIEARENILAAQAEHEQPDSPSRILLISASPRTDETCPGEMAKTYRLAERARSVLAGGGCRVDLLDLSDLGSEYGRRIFPCKACVSTAMPLCHWPCTCYPNHYMGQVQDWMNELYPRWVAAHGIMILTPVHWYQAPSGLKLMIDRLVCADGGNPDPTTTRGKDADLAKEIELEGWPYPKHLAGRLFSIVVHGDTEGAETLRRNLVDWLSGMDLVPAGGKAILERYIGYFEEYATSHEALDRDEAMWKEVDNAARVLAEAVKERRDGRRTPGEDLESPRVK